MYPTISKLALIAATLIMAATALSQTHYAYTEEGTAVNLTVQDTVISVKRAGGLQYWDDLFLAEAALNPTVYPQAITQGFTLLRVKPGFDPVALVQRLRQRSDVLFANNAYLDSYQNPIYLTETFVANFHSTVTQAQIDSMNNVHGVIVVDSLFNDPYWLLLRPTANSDHDVLTMGNLYHESELVRYAKAGMILNLKYYSEPNDPYWRFQWHFQNTGQNGGTPGADIHLAEALNYYFSPSATVTVAILDDGFAPHEDFAASRFAGGYDYMNGSPDYAPRHFDTHGMATMGIIAATTNNAVGVAGISNKVRILAQKISSGLFVEDVVIAQAFSDAVLAGARIISCSWGCPTCGEDYSSLTTWWIRKADSAGVAIVFASGNDAAGQFPGRVAWPASMPEVIAVGASDNNDQKWGYSMYGPQLDVVAPSSSINLQGDILTLDQMGDRGWNPQYMTCDSQTVDYNCAFGGTSAACPEVAGIVALLLLQRPDLVGKTEQIRQIIRHSADRTQYGSAPGDTARVNNQVGWGRVNAANALAMTCTSCGDADGNGFVNLSDAVFLINFVFNGTPVPGDCGHQYGKGDFNGDGIVNIGDAVACINFVFVGAPCPHCQDMSCWTQ